MLNKVKSCIAGKKIISAIILLAACHTINAQTKDVNAEYELLKKRYEASGIKINERELYKSIIEGTVDSNPNIVEKNNSSIDPKKEEVQPSVSADSDIEASKKAAGIKVWTAVDKRNYLLSENENILADMTSRTATIYSKLLNNQLEIISINQQAIQGDKIKIMFTEDKQASLDHVTARGSLVWFVNENKMYFQEARMIEMPDKVFTDLITLEVLNQVNFVAEFEPGKIELFNAEGMAIGELKSLR